MFILRSNTLTPIFGERLHTSSLEKVVQDVDYKTVDYLGASSVGTFHLKLIQLEIYVRKGKIWDGSIEQPYLGFKLLLLMSICGCGLRLFKKWKIRDCNIHIITQMYLHHIFLDDDDICTQWVDPHSWQTEEDYSRMRGGEGCDYTLLMLGAQTLSKLMDNVILLI